VADLRRTGRPSVNFYHLLLPHAPFEYLPSGQRYVHGEADQFGGLAGRKPLDEFLTRHGYERHLWHVAFTDRLIGALLRRLRRQGMYDDALIVVTADHGASFRRGHDRRYVNESILEDIASVPLFVKAPGQRRGRTSDAYVRTTDIAPTIADLLDIRLPWSGNGDSAFSAAVARRRSVVMRNRADRTFTMGAAEFERRQAAALQRKLALFGEGRAGCVLADPLRSRTCSSSPVSAREARIGW
jgi:Sulfatase